MRRPETLRVGARTLKTALAVFVCLLIAYFVPYSNGVYSCVSTVICMMSTTRDTLRTGLNRIVATVVACTAGLGILLLYSRFPEYYRLARLVLVPLGIVLLILLCNLIHRQGAAALACAVFLILALGAPMSVDETVVYAAIRCGETVLGIAVAFLVNRYIHPPKEEMGGEEMH